MLNSKMIFKILGTLLFLEAALVFVCLIMAFCYNENDKLAFLYTVIIALAVGGIFKFIGRGANSRMTKRDGYLVVAVSWVLFTLLGMLPFIFSGYIPRVPDAFFEMMSAFTTTGATIVNTLDSFPHALLFWRSLAQWIGGLGIVFFTLVLLPSIGAGEMKLFAAESVGPKRNKLHPRVKTTAKWILGVYLFLTLACIISLYICGMNWFDSVNHSFTTIATGGFSTHQNSIAFYNSPAIEYTESIFMILGGTNFTLLYLFLWKRRLTAIWNDAEFRCYITVLLGATGLIALSLIFHSGLHPETAFRHSLFQVSTLLTSTGLISTDYMQWMPSTWAILAVCMLFGACAGSTSGGLKNVRVVMIVKMIRNEFQHILHPNAVIPVRMNHEIITSAQERALIVFVSLYLFLTFVGSVILNYQGTPYMDAVSVCLSSIGNAGPGIGFMFGPTQSWSALPDLSKWVCSFLMLAGRLEIFCILLPFMPHFWKEH